jgi:NTP pyrophosphatase (non-canonical NTP hydrolase)
MEYQQLAGRTECDQSIARRRYDDLLAIRLNHALIGITGEVGEIAATVERWLHYNQPLDRDNVIEELGDILWYVALACNVLEVDMEEVMKKNITKLRHRYPEKYTDAAAVARVDKIFEANEAKRRELVAEMPALSEIAFCAGCGTTQRVNGKCTICGSELGQYERD